jgi:hypothetical protein
MASKREQLVKVEAVEVLPPDVQPVGPPAEEAKLQALVRREIAEARVQNEGMLFEPWFRSRRVAEEIRRLQTVPERRVSAACYERWGCMICRTKSRPHAGHSMCGRCNALHGGRRKEIKRELLGEKEHAVPRVCDGCGRRFPAMTDTKWESAYEQHKISRHHTRKVLYPEGAVARSCALCAKDFRPMPGAQWEYVRRKHERGQRHRHALRKRRARR